MPTAHLSVAISIEPPRTSSVTYLGVLLARESLFPIGHVREAN